MNYIVTEKQLKILTENLTLSNFSTELTGLIKEQSLTTPYRVMGGYTVPANEQSKCDALHGFQLSRTGANMNVKVKEELDKFSGQGVWVSNVEVTVDIDNLKVRWVVTIDKSDDGEFWNGFTSRGAGCNSGIEKRWNSEDVGNGPNSIVSKIKETGTCKGDVEIDLVKKYNASFSGNNSKFSFIQGFYRYKCLSESNTPKLQNENSKKGLDAILVGGLDNRRNKKGKLIDKTTEEQLEIFKQGFSRGGNVKVFRWTTPASAVLDYLKSSPKIPIFLYSAGCNLADDLIVSKLVDKNKLYIIEPYNGEKGLNPSVKKAIELGLNPKNIFVKKDEPGRGYGFLGASDSGAINHADALRTVPQKLNY